MNLVVVKTARGWGSKACPNGRARKRKPRGVKPIEDRVAEMIHVTCRLQAHLPRGGNNWRRRGAIGLLGGPADVFDNVEDLRQPDDWFPPNGYMIPAAEAAHDD